MRVKPTFFQDKEIGLLEEAASDTSFALDNLIREEARQRVEDELRWKTAFLEAQVDSSLDGILVVDDQGRKILQNQRMNELWKIPPHIAEDKNDAVQVAFVANRSKNPQQFAEKVAYLYSHPDEVSRDEIELDDRTILDRYSSPVRDKTGKYYGRIWAFRDITERRRLEAQLRQSQKMESIGHLAGGIAHDFNNILAAMMMQAELARMVENTPEEVREGLAGIRSSAERAADLTRQLLLFSRKQVMQPRQLNLNDAVASLTRMLQRIVPEDVSLQLHLHSTPLMTYADAGMIDQLLMNLVVNARDAMPKGGKLVIETAEKIMDAKQAMISPESSSGRYVWLSVSDTGEGIPAEVMPHIFEPFFTTKEAGKGTGLGLATVFGIVKQHKGWVNVYSESGIGTNFQIFLPACDFSTEEAAQGNQAKAKPQGGTETVLIAEDNAALRMLTRIVLEWSGYRVLEAANGIEAQHIWENERDSISLLLTDLVMPGGVDGRELAAHLQKEKADLKVLFTSGYSAEIAGRELVLLTGQNFIQKPCPPNQLLEAVRNCLDSQVKSSH